jgi:hypothetical protein
MEVMEKLDVLVQLKEKMQDARKTNMQLYHQLEQLLNQILTSSKSA